MPANFYPKSIPLFEGLRVMRSKLFTSCLQTLASAGVTLVLSGCVYRFANSERNLTAPPRTIFIAPVSDTTSRSSYGPRLMSALQRLLAGDRSFILTNQQTARWGVEVQINSASRIITKVEKCDQGNEILASGAVSCAQIRSDTRLPDISAEEEIATLSVQARGIDLESGAVLFQTNLPNLTTGAYNMVGDGTVRASLANKQDLHVLRYIENKESAESTLAQIAAQRIYENIIAVPPPSTSQ